jgi:hypothetical protein
MKEMSYITIKKKPDCDEYLITNKKGQALAQIVKYSFRKGGKKTWKFFPIFHPMDDDGKDLWFAPDCMREITDFMEKLEG